MYTQMDYMCHYNENSCFRGSNQLAKRVVNMK